MARRCAPSACACIRPTSLRIPKARNIRSIRTLNTLIYLTINIKALQRVKAINACLLRFPLTLTG